MRLTSRRKVLSELDRAEWAAYASQVAPLPGVAVPEMPQSGSLPAATPNAFEPRAAPVVRLLGVKLIAVGENPGGLDRSSWDRLRSGKLMPARTLDLHGRTAQRAYHALFDFLAAAHADRVRCVEIITGRGSGENGGVIRRELPMWLNLPALRPLVLAASHPHAANQGAVRLLLRRTR